MRAITHAKEEKETVRRDRTVLGNKGVLEGERQNIAHGRIQRERPSLPIFTSVLAAGRLGGMQFEQ
jgi:hypothetical protein